MTKGALKPFPTTEIHLLKPEDREDHEIEWQEWLLRFLVHRQKILVLLEDFYRNKQLLIDTRLTVQYKLPTNALYLESIGAETANRLPIADSAETAKQIIFKLKNYRSSSISS